MIIRGDRLPTAILSSDWHLMEKGNNPPCRTDDHWEAQADKIFQIKRLQVKYGCPVLVAGDIFEHWKPSPELINHCCRIFPKDMGVIAGQHDLPQHSIGLMEKSGLETLCHAKAVHFLWNQISWGTYESKKKNKLFYTILDNRKIAVVHMLVWKNTEPFPGCPAPRVKEVFDMFPEADLILTGDNHKTFTARQGDRLLINPGSLTRHKADQDQHRPCVFLWYADTNSFKIHYLKVAPGVISRDHIDEKTNKDKKKELFLSKLDSDFEIELSFEDNLKRAMEKNQLPKSIKKHIVKWTGR